MISNRHLRTQEYLTNPFSYIWPRSVTIFFICFLFLSIASNEYILNDWDNITNDIQSDIEPTTETEALIGAISQSTSDNTRANRGFFDTWGMTTLELIGADDPNKQTIYANLRPYTFEFTIDPLSSFENVTSITIDLEDEQINHTWYRSRGARNSQDIISSSRGTSITSSLYSFSSDLGFLDFNITFGWEGSDDTLSHRFNITIVDNASQVSKTSVSINYKVVRDLKFTGTLKVEGEFQGELEEFDWVRNTEKLTWSGLKVIYNTSQNFQVPADQGEIIITNDDGQQWLDEDPSADMRVITNADLKNDLGDTHKIAIQGPAKNNLLGSVKFTIRIDSDGITFYNATPEPWSWKNQTTLECRITIADNLTSGVDASSIEFQFSVNNGIHWSDWQIPKTKLVDDPRIIECYKTLNFLEGEVNLIKWRGVDLVGRTKLISSDIFSIKVDKNPISFKNPKPRVGEFQYSTVVDCSIDIFDPTSGVDPGSIQYSFLRDSEVNWSAWKDVSVNDSENKQLIIPEVSENFNFGKNNYIKWRAKDIAGNGYEESQEFQIFVTHRIPKIYLTSPEPGSIVNTTQPTLTWNKSYELLQPVKYIVEYWPIFDPTNITNETITDTEFTPSQPLKFDTMYYWQVTPFTDDETGISESRVWRFEINSIENIYPEYKLELVIVPDEVIRIYPGKSKSIEFIVYNKGNKDDVYQLELIAESIWNNSIEYQQNITVEVNSTFSGEIIFHIPDSGWEYRNYNIKLKITSMGATELNETVEFVKMLNILISKEKDSDTTQLWIFVLLILVILIIVVVMAAVMLRKQSKYKKYEYKPPAKEQVEIVFKPEHSRAIDRTSKEKRRMPPRPEK
jgi:hypothetical protein